MSDYKVLNSWGSSTGNPGGTWTLGNRTSQLPISIEITSTDGGKTLTGTMTYQNEGLIGVVATNAGGNNYTVTNSWGTSSGNPGGTWVIGNRDKQRVISLQVSSTDGGKTLNGFNTYEGEGHIGFNGTLVS